MTKRRQNVAAWFIVLSEMVFSIYFIRLFASVLIGRITSIILIESIIGVDKNWPLSYNIYEIIGRVNSKTNSAVPELVNAI